VREVNDDIDESVRQQEAIFIVVAVLTFMVSLAILYCLLLAMKKPLKELEDVCIYIAEDDLSAAERQAPLPERATSADMKVLLSAFSSLLVALKFGNDAYAKGDMLKAKKAFEDALELFTLICNDRGVGIAQNNLGAVYMAQADWDNAALMYTLSISNAQVAILFDASLF